MLAPDVRTLLVDNLRAPDGYRFDRGVGTTFTLDLLSLLIVPLSLTVSDLSTDEALTDPLLLLESLRRHADRLALFCQAGRIAVPPSDNQLYSLLEEMVVEVRPPRPRAVFHPKIWLLRYLANDGEASPVYRLLNLSRNLTFDRSWDLMLRLDGELDETRRYAFARNHPLGDLIQALPTLACHGVSERIRHDIDLLQDEVRRVRFVAPEPFSRENLALHPLGLRGRGRFPCNPPYDRVMIISPFLSNELLQRVAQDGAQHVLISRPDSIGDLQPDTRGRFETLYVLDEHAMADADVDTAEDTGAEVTGARPEPSGLHAKLFVLESGQQVTWLVGSANATNAAFQRNVEFMVELQGPKHCVGIDRVLGGADDDATLRSLLIPFAPGAEPETDRDAERAQNLAEEVQRWIVALDMSLGIQRRDEDRFDLTLSIQTAPAPRGDYASTCWPITLRPERALAFPPPDASPGLTFAGISLLGLTPFMAFSIRARCGEREHTLSFVRNLPITGIPQERTDHLFRAIIADRQGFLRYLWLILMAGEEEDVALVAATGAQGSGWWREAIDGELPLFEALVRALSRSPDKIDRIVEVVERLGRTSAGEEVLPEGFASLWETILQARSSMI